jgi:hypothetical protein
VQAENHLVSANDAVLSPAGLMTDPGEVPKASLVDPNVPADQGLSSLGLLLQLGGTIFAAYASLVLFIMLFLPSGIGGVSKGYILLVLVFCIVRSAAHRVAGTELLYGRPQVEGTASPLAGIKRYILVAFAQTAIMAVLLAGKFGVPFKYTAAICVGLAAWPVVLAVFLQLPRFKRYATSLPVGEDKGFEAAGILMTVLGTCGVLGTGTFLIVMLDSGSRILSQGPGVLLLVALVMLLIRSILHVKAGLSNLRETNLDRAVELANRYANFGVISSFCAAGALLIVSMAGAVNIAMVAVVAGVCWILLAWPMIIRRFYSERQFADLMAGDEANLHRRAPDAGMTGFGWLLVAHAMFGATFLIPQLVIGPDVLDSGYGRMLSFMGPLATRSMWWSAGLISLQAWAGFELIRMSPHSRIIGIVFAVVASAVTVYLMWPVLQSFGHLSRMMSPDSLLIFIPLAIQLVIPVSTLILVNRKIAPTAQARFRSPATRS